MINTGNPLIFYYQLCSVESLFHIHISFRGMEYLDGSLVKHLQASYYENFQFQIWYHLVLNSKGEIDSINEWKKENHIWRSEEPEWEDVSCASRHIVSKVKHHNGYRTGFSSPGHEWSSQQKKSLSTTPWSKDHRLPKWHIPFS